NPEWAGAKCIINCIFTSKKELTLQTNMLIF
ncbi:MAG: hypothetical protein ACI83I_001384, partial [Bacteroidia bacterium]